jgi:hypothetical protein
MDGVSVIMHQALGAVQSALARAQAISGLSSSQLQLAALFGLGSLVLLYLLWDVVSALAIPSLDVATTEGEQPDAGHRGLGSSRANQSNTFMRALLAAEREDVINAPQFDPSAPLDKDVVPCYDPGNMQLLGHVPAMSATEVRRWVLRWQWCQSQVCAF